MFKPEKDCSFADDGKCFVMSSELLQELAITNPSTKVCDNEQDCQARNRIKFFSDDESEERIPLTIYEYFLLPDDGGLPEHDLEAEHRYLDED